MQTPGCGTREIAAVLEKPIPIHDDNFFRKTTLFTTIKYKDTMNESHELQQAPKGRLSFSSYRKEIKINDYCYSFKSRCVMFSFAFFFVSIR